MAKLQNTFKKGKEFVLFERGKPRDSNGLEDREGKKDQKLNENGDGIKIMEDQKNKKINSDTKDSQITENKVNAKENEHRDVTKNKEENKNQKDKEKKEVAKNKKDLKTAEDSIKLNNLAKMTENRLYKLSAVFPFDFFPNQVIIEQKQIIIKYRQFFFVTQEYHVLIEDILMPVVETSVLFAKLRLEMGPGGFQQNPPPIAYLKKNEAAKAKRIIIGLLICIKEQIDLEDLEKNEFLEKIEEIGRFRSD